MKISLRKAKRKWDEMKKKKEKKKEQKNR